MNEFEYTVSWNNLETISIPKEDLYIEIEGINFNFYSINCVKVL